MILEYASNTISTRFSWERTIHIDFHRSHIRRKPITTIDRWMMLKRNRDNKWISIDISNGRHYISPSVFRPLSKVKPKKLEVMCWGNFWRKLILLRHVQLTKQGHRKPNAKVESVDVEYMNSSTSQIECECWGTRQRRYSTHASHTVP